VRITAPPAGGKVDLEKAVGDVIRDWHARYNLKVVVYDEFQLHHLMQQMRTGKRILCRDFSQRSGRLKADKQCYDMIVAKDIEHQGDRGLREHVDNAQKKSTDERTMRFVALDERHPIDALVALSMASWQVTHLIL
jgi:phage terminase large subunit-like protein